MGVSGLLALLKSIQTPTHLRQFSGQTIGVDAYGWLHRGAVACSINLALGKPSTKYVEFAMHRVRMLVHFGVIPYLVFDGDRLPGKAATEHERAERRRESKNAGMELLKLGKTAQAQQELQKAVDITPEMAAQLIAELRRNSIRYVVAPYEADSQLAYLEREGLINGILSEDSDLLVFGAKTLLTKLDQYGECIMIRQADFTSCREVNLTGWTCADLRCMAILSGCDYLEGIHRMGLKTAYRLVRKCKTIQRVIQCAQLDGKFRVPAGYLESFTQAEMTFLYQWVYCPTAKMLVNLTNPESEDQLNGVTYIGQYVEPQIATQVATGHINPFTKLPMVVEWPSNYKQPPLIPTRNGKENTSREGKKIDSFFTPSSNRIPLGELDPNSFKPSQSQQRVLERNNERSWVPVLANARPGSAQPPRTDDRGNQPSRNIVSAPHPTKRQRLCAIDEGGPVDALINGQEERSRFFSSKPPQQNLSEARSGRSKKGQKADINIWSDDSVADAMAALPDFDQNVAKINNSMRQTKSRSFSIFKEGQKPAKKTETTTLDEAERFYSGVDCPEGKDEEESPFTASLEAQTEAFRERYSLRKPTDPINTKDEQSAIDSSADSLTPPGPATPLTSSHLAYKLPSEELDLETMATIKETPLGKANVEPLEESPLTRKYDAERATTTQDAPRLEDDTTCASILHPKGSEDLFLVPDSDAETGSSECGPDTDTTPRRGIGTWSDNDAQEQEGTDAESSRPVPLDLKKFAFAARNASVAALSAAVI